MKIQIAGFVLDPTIPTQASTNEQKLQAFKRIRDIMLLESDWTQVADSPLSETQKEQWRSWRQYLRNFSQTLPEQMPDFVVIQDPPMVTTNQLWHNFDPENNLKYKEFLIQTGFIDVD